MSLLSKINEFEDKINLKKKFPDYFNKTLFRCYIVVLVIGFALMMYLYGFQNYLYVSCQADAVGGKCSNPIYVCDNPLFVESGCIPSNDIPPQVKEYCDKGYCSRMYLDAGETIGKKQPWIMSNFSTIVWLSLLFIFFENHLLYNKRKGLKLKNQLKAAYKRIKEGSKNGVQ